MLNVKKLLTKIIAGMSFDYSQSSSATLNTDISITTPSVLIGHCQAYSSGELSIKVNGTEVQRVYNSISGFGVTAPFFLLLNKGDTLRLDNTAQYVTAKLYTFGGGTP